MENEFWWHSAQQTDGNYGSRPSLSKHFFPVEWIDFELKMLEILGNKSLSWLIQEVYSTFHPFAMIMKQEFQWILYPNHTKKNIFS